MPRPVADVRRPVHAATRSACSITPRSRASTPAWTRAREPARDGVRRTEAHAVLRSGEARVRDRDLRRPLPRAERRDPRHRPEPALPIRREEGLRLPFRLRRPGAPAWARAARADARIRAPDPRERRIDARIVPRAAGPGRNGRLPERTGCRGALCDRRGRDAARGTEDRRGSGAARLADRRHRRARRRSTTTFRSCRERSGSTRPSPRRGARPTRPTPRPNRRATGSGS